MAKLGAVGLTLPPVDIDDPRLAVFAEQPMRLAHAIAGIAKFIELQPAPKRAEIARACAVLGVTVPVKVVDHV